MADAPAGVAAETWQDHIRRCISGDGIRPVFQPIVDMARASVAGFEALARFEHGPPAAPNTWFAEAARFGLLVDLEAAVLDAQLAHRSALPVNTFLTVNVEPESLVADRIVAVLRSHAPLNGLVIEVTEHRGLGDPTRVRIAIDELRRHGAMIAVDDAGAGYSGLQQILTLRPQILKLDRALIDGIDRDEAKTALVEMLGVFASRIDAWVLAEGIETEGEARRCAALGVPLAQGYYFARPAPPWQELASEARAMLESLAADRHHTDTLHRLLRVVASVPDGATADVAVLLADSANDVIVVTRRDRPIGMLTPSAALAGRLLPGLAANVNTSPAELAHRLAAAPEDVAALPVMVTDNAGRYVGVVTMPALLRTLAGDL